MWVMTATKNCFLTQALLTSFMEEPSPTPSQRSSEIISEQLTPVNSPFVGMGQAIPHWPLLHGYFFLCDTASLHISLGDQHCSYTHFPTWHPSYSPRGQPSPNNCSSNAILPATPPRLHLLGSWTPF